MVFNPTISYIKIEITIHFLRLALFFFRLLNFPNHSVARYLTVMEKPGESIHQTDSHVPDILDGRIL